MKKLDESSALWLKKYAGTLTENEERSFKNIVLESSEAVSIYKPMSPEPGKTVSNKVRVKSFKNKDVMHDFLNKQTDNVWKETGEPGLKSGTYKLNMVRGKDGKPVREFIRV